MECGSFVHVVSVPSLVRGVNPLVVDVALEEVSTLGSLLKRSGNPHLIGETTVGLEPVAGEKVTEVFLLVVVQGGDVLAVEHLRLGSGDVDCFAHVVSVHRI